MPSYGRSSPSSARDNADTGRDGEAPLTLGALLVAAGLNAAGFVALGDESTFVSWLDSPYLRILSSAGELRGFQHPPSKRHMRNTASFTKIPIRLHSCPATYFLLLMVGIVR